MAAGKMDIGTDLETDLPGLFLSIPGITLGKKSREEMTDSRRRKEAEEVSQVLCGLLNSGGGVVKAKIRNEDYKLSRDGIGQDLENSFSDILPFVPQCLEFKQDGGDFLIVVKSQSLRICALPVATLATNLYIRNGASSVQMDVAGALKLLKDVKDTRGRLHLKAELPDERSEDGLQEERHVEDLAAAFFNETKLKHKMKFFFAESKNVEYKSFNTNNLLKRIKEILPQTVSAFANTDGGYLFVGLDDKDQEVIGFEAEKSYCVKIEAEIKRYIHRLPVYHFCEEKEEIKYSCRFIEVRIGESVCSYVCALRVERFCCAVFAKEPDSRHVEDKVLKPFTTKEWVKRLMDGSQD